MTQERVSYLSPNGTLDIPKHIAREFHFMKERKYNFLHVEESVYEHDGKIRIPDQVIARNNWQPGMKFSFVAHCKESKLAYSIKDMEIYVVPTPTLEKLGGIAKGANTNFHRDRDDRF